MHRQTFGIPGVLGALMLVVWVVGWAAFGWHEGFFHLLVPIGLALIVIQIVRRVAVGG